MTPNSSAGDEVDRLIRQASFCLERPDADARLLASCIKDLRAVAWERKLRNEPRTWERLCQELLGADAGDLEEIIAGVAALQQAGLLNPTVAQAREALRFEVDYEAEMESEPLPEPPRQEGPGLDETLTRLQRLRLDWLRLTASERDEFLTWARIQHSNGEKEPKRKPAAGRSKRKR